MVDQPMTNPSLKQEDDKFNHQEQLGVRNQFVDNSESIEVRPDLDPFITPEDALKIPKAWFINNEERKS